MSTLWYNLRTAAAGARRFGRLVVFGFEQIVLSRLFERRKLAKTVTAALLRTKDIALPPPELEVFNASGAVPNWSHGFNSVNAALFLNLRTAGDLSAGRHALPAPAFRGVYLWDSAFIAQVWKWWDPEVAFDVLDAVVRGRDGDRLQHFISEFAASDLTQPPLLAWSLARLDETAPRARFRVWAERHYDALAAYHRWLQAHRRLADGTYAWAHAYESGVENAPRFGARDERALRDTRQTGAPDLCAYMVLQSEALAVLALSLDRPAEARTFYAMAGDVRAATDAQLWCDDDGLYFDRDAGGRLRSRTVASLLPLWAGIPDETQAARLVAHVLDPAQFNTLIPIPSVALSDRDFERDMWRGPVWINTAFAVIEGLRRYGYHDEATELAFRLCDGVYRTHHETGHFYEFYDPTALGVKQLHRKRGNRWKRLTLGAGPVTDFVGWTGLVNTTLLEMLFGLHGSRDAPALQPRFPERAAGWRFALALPVWDASVDLEVLPGRVTRGEIEHAGARRAFSAAFGEKVSFHAMEPAPA